ncbi:HNH endonuclease [Streptococcus salivarius]
MRTVKAPEINLNVFYDSLVETIRENTIVPSCKDDNSRKIKAKSAFNDAKQVLLKAEKLYLDKLKQGKVNEIPKGRYVKHNNTADDLINEDYKWFYKKFRHSDTTSTIVDKLLNISSQKCIYCESRHGNDELDHFLPESEYDYLTIVPANLLPSCSRCNKKKLAITGEIYHPYFSDFSAVNFISCEILIYSQTSSKHSVKLGNSNFHNVFRLKYKLVDESSVPDKTLYNKVRVVFEILDLSKRYSEMMTEILDEDLYELQEMLKNTNLENFKGFLKIRIKGKSDSYSNNSCIIPFYLSLLNLLEKSSYFVEIFKSL